MRFLRQTLLSVCLILPCAIAFGQAPIADNDAASGPEDSNIVIPILGNDLAGGSAIDPASVDLDPGGPIDPSRIVTEGTFMVDASGIVTFTPLPNYFGPVTSISYTVEGVDDLVSNAADINVTVDAVDDDPPTIGTITDQTMDEDGTLAVGFTIGDPDGFTGVTVTGQSDNDAIIPDGNVIISGSGASRTATITPLLNQSGGPVTITITVNDGGPLPATRTFTVTVNALNDSPTIGTITNQTMDEDGTLAVGFTIGDPDGFTGVTVTGQSDNDAIIPDGNVIISGSGASRTATITPLLNQSGGPVTITITVNDGGPLPATRTFTVTVNALNDSPTIGTITNQTMDEDGTLAVGFTIGDPDGFTGVTVTGQSDNDAIIPDGNVIISGSGASRTATITPLLNQSGGPVTITITVNDGGPLPATRTFTVTVNALNDSPTIGTITNQTMDEDGTLAVGFTIGDPDGFTGVTVTGQSDNDAIIPDGNVIISGSGASRTATITPLLNQSGGPVTITITVNDGGPLPATRTFTVTVNALNDSPTIGTITNQTMDEDGTLAVGFTIGDPDGFTGVTVTGQSDNDAIIPDGNVIISGSGASRTATITPLLNQSGGPVTITITVNDGGPLPATRTFTVTVNALNDSPTIGTITNQTMDEDGTLAVGFTIGDPDGFTGVTVTGQSDNDAIIPDGNVIISGSGASRTATITPLLNQSGGPVTITITVNDGGPLPASRTFTVTVNALNDSPTIGTITNQTMDEDGTLAVGFTIGDPDGFTGVTVTGQSDNDAIIPDGNVIISGSGASRTATITPLLNQSGGPVTITITVNDGGPLPASRTFTVTVNALNDSPTIGTITNQTMDEDGTLAVGFTIGDPDGFTGVTVTGQSDNDAIIPDGNVIISGSGASRTATITPLLNQSGGPVTITITVNDGGPLPATRTFTVTVNALNDSPTIGTITNQTINEDGSITALAFTIADVDTPLGSIAVSGTSGNQSIIPNANITTGGSGANRTVTIIPLANQSGGPVTITITASDGSSSSTTFGVTVNSINDPPTITPIGNQTTNEDTPTSALTFTVNDIDTPVGSLSVTGTSNATNVIPDANIVIGGTGATRTVTLTPAPEQSGLAVITLTVYDGTTYVPMSFAVTVTPVSDPPTITTIPNQLIDEDSNTGALPFTIADIDNPVGSLTITRGSSNLALVPISNIVIGGSGANQTVTVTPAADQTGIAVITLTVSDGTTSVPTTFQVTVDGFNDPPTISAISNQSTTEDVPTAAIPFTVGDPETPAVDLTVTASSDNVGVIPNANIAIVGSGANRTVQVTPEPNQSGAAIITLTVSDGVNSTSRTFQVTVNTVDDPPTITTIPNQTITEDTQTTALAFTINDVETPIPSLTVTTSSSNLTLVPLANITLGGSGASQTVLVTPVANQFGVAVITVSVNDGSNTTSTTFQVTVSPVNDLPTITAISDQTINEDTPTTALAFTITDIETPLASLTVTGNSDNTALVPVANIVFTGSGGSRTVTVTPAVNQTGVATITLTLSDGTANVPTTFQVTVNPVNDAPVITGQTVVSTSEEQPLDIEFSHLVVTDVDNAFPTGFTLTVLPNTGYSIVDNTITPNNNVTGNITVRVQVNDGALNSNIYNLLVTVNPINDPPVITGQSTLTILEDNPLTFLISHLTITDPDNASGFTFSLGAGSNYSVSGGNIITPGAHFNGTLSVPVTVSDGGATSAPYNVQIQVTAVNDKPQITGQTPISIAEVQPVAIDLSQLTVFDPDNAYPADFDLNVLSGPNYTINENVVTPVPNFSGTLLVRLFVSDGALDSDVYNFQITVNSTNDPPVITGQRPLNTEENEPIEIQFVDLIVSDPDNTYPTGFTLTILPGTNYTFSGTTVTPNPNISGVIDVRVKVNDGAVDSAPYPLKIDVNSVNDAPAITGQLPMTTLEDTPINMSMGFLIISDPDSPISGFTMQISPGPNYILTGVEIKPVANFNGTLSVPVTVNDGSLESQPYNVQIQVTPVNDAPVITGQNPLSTLEDQPITLKLADFLVTDIDNTFPTGFTLQVAQGSFANYDVVGTTVTPKTNFNGTLGVTMTISDGVATSNSFPAEIVVNSINDPPTLDPVGNVTVAEDPAEPSVISLTGITAGVGEGTQSVVVTISTANPELFEVLEVTYTGGTIASVRIKPKADKNGAGQVTIRIQDDGAGSPSPNINFFDYSFAYTIDPQNDAPAFTSQPDKLAETAQAFEYDIVVSDVEQEVITITAPTLPSWLILTQASNGLATLSGIPPLGTTGEAAVVIVASDPTGLFSTQEFSIVVNARPTITPFAISTDEDKKYTFTSEFTSNYNDADGNAIATVQIKQLPTKGTLFLGDNPVSINAEIPASEINSNKLNYRPSTDSNGTDIIKWNASDGIFYSILDANIVVSIIPFNDPPEIIALEAPEVDTLKYELGSEVPVKLTKIFDARDPEGDNIIAAEIGFQASTDYREGKDIFSFKDTLGIVGAFIKELGVLTLTGKASVQDYVAAIRTVRYNYLDATPLDESNRKVSIRLNDGAFGGTKERLVGLVYTNPGLDIANAFTPNGDIENQYWKIYSPAGLERYKEALIRVYDKRGVLVYQATGFSTPWNGEGPNGALPADSYFYTIDLKYDKKKYKGVVTILR